MALRPALEAAVTDTRELRWDPFPPGLAGARRKMLEIDADGEPAVMLVCLPAGSLLPEGAHRHYHRSLDDANFVLWGWHPLFEYRSPAQQHGTLTVWRPGYFLRRLAGSIHGIEPGPLAPTACVTVHWRTKAGNWVGDTTYEQETIGVPFADGWRPDEAPVEARAGADGVVVDWPLFRELDTRAMRWQAAPGGEGVCRKVLDRAGDGAPTTALTFLPPGRSVLDLPAGYDFDFVLSGALPLDGAERPAREGAFIRRRALADAAGEAVGAASQTGTVVLSWRAPG